MSTLEVIERADGRFAVQTIGGATLDDISAPFDTRAEAEEWLLDHAERLADNAGSHILRPGGGQAFP